MYMKTQPLKYTLIAITTALLTTAMTVFAAPFTPGQTLDPGCNPGDVDCYVSGGGSDTDWTQDTNGVWNTTDKIGIGTNTPGYTLEVQGDTVTQQATPQGQQYLVNSQDTLTISLPAYDTLFGAPNALSGPLGIAGAYKTIDDQIGVVGVLDNSQWAATGGDESAAPGMMFVDNATQSLGFATLEQDGFNINIFDDPAGSVAAGFLNFSPDGLNLRSFSGGYTLPLSDGTTGQVLTTDGSGNVSWTTAGSGGGSITSQDEGVDLTTATSLLNFTGAGVTATNSGGSVTVSIPGGTGEDLYLYDENIGSAGPASATGDGAVAVGYSASATGDWSQAFGINTQATNIYSTAIGLDAIASGAGSAIALPSGRASGASSFAYKGIASGSSAIALVTDSSESPSYRETIFGSGVTSYIPTSAGGWNSNDRLLTIGNGDSSFSSFSDAFTILKNGQVGIGADNFESITNGNMFQVWDGNGNMIGYVDDATGNWTPVSDERLKKNIKDLDYGLDTINQLNPVHYKLIRNNKDNIGFLAQDVKSVIPEIVSGDDDKGYGLSYAALTPVLTKALQELDDKVEQSQVIYALQKEDKNFLKNILESTIKKVDELFAKKVTTDQLCIGNTCITEQELQELLAIKSGMEIQTPITSISKESEKIETTDTVSNPELITPAENTTNDDQGEVGKAISDELQAQIDTLDTSEESQKNTSTIEDQPIIPQEQENTEPESTKRIKDDSAEAIARLFAPRIILASL